MLLGSVPIMIGHKAVDPITGELSPINGVRVNPETKQVIPVTLSSGGYKKRKPPLGAVAMLEEESVARRSFWRRQRDREAELTMEEFNLSQRIMHNIETVNLKKVEGALITMNEKSHSMSEAFKGETQRRGAAHQELSAVIPLNILTIITEGDEDEGKAEEDHYTSHTKFGETIRKFAQKLEAEEKRFKDRLEELVGAMNPDAEKVTRQRYAQACARLQNELRDQIMSRMEHLDEDQSECEYYRQLNELRLKEAKAVLNGDTLVAGDFDCSLSGTYGDTHSNDSSSNQELIPLLKQLLSLLESGKPFVINADSSRGGDTNIVSSSTVPIGRSQARVAPGGAPIQPVTVQQTQSLPTTTAGQVKAAETQIVQHSVGPVGSDNVSNIIVDASKLVKTSAGEDPKELHRNLFTKQTYEAAKLENDLKNNEISEMNGIIEEFEKKKKGVIGDVSKDLRKKLAAANTEEEKEKIMLEYAQNMQKLNDALERQKQQEMEALRRRLLDRRRQDKKVRKMRNSYFVNSMFVVSQFLLIS